jgi:hypothetical protein
MESAAPFARLLLRFSVLIPLLRTLVGQQTWAVTALTWKAAFRFRLFWVLAVLLLGSVVILPLLIKDDGTARGFIQITLTYTLSVITTLLGLSTLWLACGTLARDIEDASMQLVVVKPIARWQIWLGKWLGLVLLNATLLTVAGGGVYAMLQWRTARIERDLARAKTAKDEQLAAHLATQLNILRSEIFVARASLKEPAPDIDVDVEQQFQKIPNRDSMSPEQQQETRLQLKERITAFQQVVPPGHRREWTLDLGLRRHLVRDQPLFLRVKFHAAQTNQSGTYLGLWQVGPFDSPKSRSIPQSLADNTFHEIIIPPNMVEEDGRLIVNFVNRNNVALIFPLGEGLEVLYREGGFGLNFARGMGIIWCWLALLASLGLAASSLMSFPVAAFVSISLLAVAFFSGTMRSVVEQGTLFGVDHETGAATGSLLDGAMIVFYKAILWLVDTVQGFSPVEALSTGRSIGWGELGLAALVNIVLVGGVLSLFGMLVFAFRELATAQTQA